MNVDLLPTEEQGAIRDSVAAALAKQFPVDRLHDEKTYSAGAERAKWEVFTGLGVFGLGLPEALGGVGYGLAEEVTVARELGRHLISPAVLATMVAAHVVTGDRLAALVSGDASAAFANPVGPVDFSAAAPLPVQLLDAAGADYVLVWNDRAAALYRPPVVDSHVEALDETVSLARASLDLGQPVAVVDGPGIARRAGLILSAYLAGNAESTLAMAVEYAKVREQFGQPIGAFQAIKHYCAEMARRAEASVAQTFYAALDASERCDDDMFEAAAARLLAAEAAVTNGRYNVQIHGGMGFTYEADAHRFLKRALLVSAIASGPRLEQQRIMASRGPA